MNHGYKRKGDPSLLRPIVVLLVIAGVAGVAWTLVRKSRGTDLYGRDATAASDLLRTANDLYARGDLDGAHRELASLVPNIADPQTAPQALVLLARIEAAQGMYDSALARLAQTLEQFPSSPHQPTAAIAYARLLERIGNTDEAVSMYEQVIRTASPEVRAPARVGLARAAERAGHLEEAKSRLHTALEEAHANSEAWNEAIEGLGRVNVALIFSPVETSDSKMYSVAPGDSIASIGNALNTTQALLIRANRLADPTRLNVGQRLKYTPKDFSIVIERTTCRLYVLDKDGLFKQYRTGLGRPGQETTLGKYKIGNKQVDPTWFKPGSGPIPPGDPRNELGTRWMPMVPVDEGLPTDLGIHGTIAPETIGQYASSGCPRLFKEDVEELYDLVVRATPVEIVEVIDPARLLGQPHG